jgi:hypothetical protein
MVISGSIKDKVMVFLKKIFFLLIWIFTMSVFPQVRIVLSAALTDAHYEFRKAQYIKSFNILNMIGYKDVYVIEALKKHGHTFLDDFSKNVFYATTNDRKFTNQGTNEARTCLEGIDYFKFDPEDIILKITGRYQLKSDRILKIIRDNPDFDAYIKLAGNGDVYTACFAMRCKYFQEVYRQIDLDRMEKDRISLETEVARYIKNKVATCGFKVYYVDTLDIEANLFGSSACPGIPENTVLNL